jgi:Ribbon-helix-helix domain
MYNAMYVHKPSLAPVLTFDAHGFVWSTWCVMARKKISTTIYITPEQNESLKLLHERTKVPIAVYIREGIDLVLKEHQSELPGQLTLVAAGGEKKS